jgi:hypothetical protein
MRLYTRDMTTGKIKSRVTRKLDLIANKFEVVESPQFDVPGLPTVVVFRPLRQSMMA